MSTTDDRRDADQIESDIERARAEVSATIDAIQSKLTPGQMMDQAIAYLRDSGTGEFGSNLGRTVRDNPVPVALIGVGIAWLAMGGSRPRGPLEDRARAAPRTSTAAMSWGTGDSGYVDDDWTDGATSDELDEPGLASRIASAGVDAGGRARDAVSGTAARVKDTLSDTTGRVRESMSDAARRTRERMGALRGHASSIQGSTREQFERARDRTMRMIDEQPLVLGAIGIAIGAAIGAALPRTRREDRWMGEMRDGLVEGAADTARESMHDVAESARRVARTAHEEVDRAVDARDPSRDGAGLGAAARDRSPDPTLPGAPY